MDPIADLIAQVDAARMAEALRYLAEMEFLGGATTGLLFHGLLHQRAVAAWCAVAFSMTLSIVCLAAETPSVRPIPYKPDPPPAIDGRIEDWQTVPNGLDLRDRAHATYAPQRWKSAQDLSARACLAWREEYL